MSLFSRIKDWFRSPFVRFVAIFVLSALAVVCVIVKIFVIQTVERSKWLEVSKRIENSIVDMPAIRGNIFSCDGQLLASSVPSYYVYMDTQTEYLRKNNGKNFMANVDSLAWKMSSYFRDKSAAEYKNLLVKGFKQKNRALRLRTDLVSQHDYDEIKKFPLLNKGQNKGGLYATKVINRVKPYGTLGSYTIGELSKENNKGGVCGLELAFDTVLRGKTGRGERIKFGASYQVRPLERPQNGLDIITTFDVDMQDICEKALAKAVALHQPFRACVLLMEVKTGEVKACTNLRRGVDGRYRETDDISRKIAPEPGSTFKTMSMMVLLENNLVTPNDVVNAGDGVCMMHGSKMTDSHPNGVITMTQVMAQSSNIGMSLMVDKFFDNNRAKFVDELYKMSVGKQLNFEFKDAAKPNVRHPKDAGVSWSGTTLPWMSIGYETQMPPIYTLAFYNAIANNGKFIKPFFVKAISENGHIKKSFSAEVVNSKICSSHTLRDIRMMLRAVVTDGTGRRANSKYVSIAGKTGTAQVNYGRGQEKQHNISFCGFFPADEPLYSFMIFMEHPQGIADAGSMCAPVAKDIAERIYSQKVFKTLPDTVSYQVPYVKGGQTEAVAEVLDELDLNCSQSSAEWARVVNNGAYAFQNVRVEKYVVPNVLGMGANDAVYLLENAGLRVQLYGRGRVQSQSIAAGSRIVQGQTITIELR